MAPENIKSKLKKLNKIQVIYHILGDFKGILKHRIRHLSRHTRYNRTKYYTIREELERGVLIKHDGAVYMGEAKYLRHELIREVVRMCKGIERPLILEIGCGTGVNLYLLNKCLPDSRLTGWDNSQSQVDNARRNLSGYAEVSLVDIEKVVTNNKYHIVFTSHCLEQLGQANAKKAMVKIWDMCICGAVFREPSTNGVSLYERIRMYILGYCKDLHKIAAGISDAVITGYYQCNYRTWPNTSNILILKRL